MNEKLIDPLGEPNDGSTPFHRVCIDGYLEVVKFLIEENGCNPMYYNGKVHTPYAMACACGNLNVVRYLTEERQCDPLRKDTRGFHAVSIAACCRNVNVLKYFVEERGCDLEACGEYKTVLQVAYQQNNLEAIRYLSTIGTSSTSKLSNIVQATAVPTLTIQMVKLKVHR